MYTTLRPVVGMGEYMELDLVEASTLEDSKQPVACVRELTFAILAVFENAAAFEELAREVFVAEVV